MFINSSPTSSASASSYAALISLIAILSIAAGIVLFFVFLNKKNDGRFTGFGKFMYEFLNFRTMLVDAFLRILYVALAVFVTLMSFFTLFSTISYDAGKAFLSFLGILIGGNVAVRLSFEFTSLLIIVCRNTSGINRKLGCGSDTPSAANPPATPFYNYPSDNNSGADAQPEPAAAPVPDVSAESTPAAESCFCINCGTKLNADNTFCPNCGMKKQ